MKSSDILVAAGIFMIVILIIVPLNPMLLDFLLIISISLSILVLLTSLFIKETLEFSVFPPLLLILTLFRLALNISSTRLILSNGGEAGAVIKTFGGFVIGGNLVVGVIIFAIIIIIQFVVITKGAERVAEVAARFTLDAMPGKQMAIDADLNAGLINEAQARERRSKIQREADFYGAMDGASKFVKGDAIVGILIVIINMIGGMVIGLVTSGLPIGTVISLYTLASVGDGLVSQLPALLISTATGIIVTRTASENNLGRELSSQLTAQPNILILAGFMILAMSLIPGLPKFAILMLSFVFFGLGFTLKRQSAKPAPIETTPDTRSSQEKQSDEINNLLTVDPVELELGYGLINLASSMTGGLAERIIMIRKQCASELGVVVPAIRLHDNVMLKTQEYLLKIRGNEVGRGEIMPDHYLALHTELVEHEIKGIPTFEPSFGLPAIWITSNEKERAELLGYTVIDPASVLTTHLAEMLKRHSHELLDRQQVSTLVGYLRQVQPALVEEVFPKLYSFGDLQRVLAGLLRELIPIRDLPTIVETLADHAGQSKNPEQLVEQVRQRLRRTITRKVSQSGRVQAITLDPRLEQLIIEKLRQTEHGSFIALTPDQMHQVLSSLKNAAEEMAAVGHTPIVLTAPAVRPHFKKLSEQLVPDLMVLSYSEIDASVEIQAERMVGLHS